MLYRPKLLILILLSLFIISCEKAAKEVTEINKNTTIYINPNEDIALHTAAKDLANDMEMVFGKSPKIVSTLAQCSENTIVISDQQSLPEGVEKPVGWEKLKIQILEEPFEDMPIKNGIILTGSDKRGAIYAIYEFSERFLGVDPLYWWIDKEPEKKLEVTIPKNYLQENDSPTVKYRGLFINDEDLLSGWMSGTWRFDAIRPEAWNRIFEAILRMKGNMVTPGTFNFPYEPQVKQAAERGLIHTQDHVEVLGLNTLRWPKDVHYSLSKNRNKLISAWSKAVEQYPEGIEIIWTLGYRGLQDRPFWEDDPSSPKSDQEKADIILEAITLQMDIVKERFENPYFLMNTWGEGTDFIRKGYLKIPEEVHLVWADDGRGIILDEGDIKPGEGAYYHTAMFNSKGNQLSEQIPIERIQGELTRMINAGATEYLLVNSSDLRPVVMSTKATMQIAYDATEWLENKEYHNTYLRDWCADNFGENNADQVAEIFSRYYKAPAQFGREYYELASDVFYHRYARQYLRRMIANGEETFIKDINGSLDAIANARNLTTKMSEATPRWEELLTSAEELKGSIADDRKDFYQTNVILPISVHLHSNNILRDVTKAFLLTSVEERTKLLVNCLNEIDLIYTSLEKAEYGKWKDFYLNDLMLALPTTKKCLEIVKKEINGEQNYQPIYDYISTWAMWDMMKAYQGRQLVPM